MAPACDRRFPVVGVDAPEAVRVTVSIGPADVFGPAPVEVIVVALGSRGPDHLRDRLGKRLEVALARLGQRAAIVDVDRRSDPAHERAVRVAHRGQAAEMPAIRVVRAAHGLDAHLALEAVAARRVFRAQCAEASQVVGRHHQVDAQFARLFVTREAGVVEPALIDPIESSIGRLRPDHLRNLVGELPETRRFLRTNSRAGNVSFEPREQLAR